jgi:hypothetical protein
MSEIISFLGVFGLGALTAEIIKNFFNSKKVLREEKLRRYSSFIAFMVAYLNPHQQGFHYNHGKDLKTQITKAEARDNLISTYTAFFLNDNKDLLRLLKSFIDKPDEEKFFLILNELRQELGNNRLAKELTQELIVKIVT